MSTEYVPCMLASGDAQDCMMVCDYTHYLSGGVSVFLVAIFEWNVWKGLGI